MLPSMAAIALVMAAAQSPAQIRISDSIGGPNRSPLAGLEGDANLDDPVRVAAQFTPATADRPAVLILTAQIAPGYHVYSLTQPPGGPTKTKIDVTPSPQFRLLGPFSAFPEPKSHIDQVAWPGLELQEHDKEVTWYAPIELTASTDAGRLEIHGTIRMLACKESCIPANATFVARQGDGVPIGPLPQDAQVSSSEFTSAAPVPSAAQPAPIQLGPIQLDGSEVQISGRIVPNLTSPGSSATLEFTLTPPAGFHVFAYSESDNQPGSKPTLIAFEQLPGLKARRPTTDKTIIVDTSVPEFGTMRYHDGPVTWQVRIDVPADTAPGSYPIAGMLGYQACETRADGMGSCELPKATRFQANLTVGTVAGSAAQAISFSPSTYKEAANLAATWAAAWTDGAAPTPSADPATLTTASELVTPQSPTSRPQSPAYDLSRVVVEQPTGSLGYYIALAFLGGILLNLMPCVLPVIGLKVMSFAQQAGQSRAHAFKLNVWYAAGIVAVFLLLGLLAATIGLTWGGQFGSTTFNAILAALVFAMALSLLGVWEIPIPGFFGSGSVQAAASQEGPFGAFRQGVGTTILATPCTGPFMASAIAWAVTQSLANTLTVFGALGLGMASPYLIVGVYPQLLRFLPKPGAWMETFKQIMGFILLGTVVFILSFMKPAALVPMIVLLLGVGVACWLFARTPLTAAFIDRLQTWALSAAIVLLFGVMSFGYLYPQYSSSQYGAGTAVAVDANAPWQPFSLEKLRRMAVDERRTVLVDFSAEWCLTCKTLEKAVLHTAPVEQAIAASGAATMYADFTDYPPEIEQTIRALKSNGVPVIAIFPGDRPYEPIVFRNGYTKNGLISALEQATGRRLAPNGEEMADVALSIPPLK